MFGLVFSAFPKPPNTIDIQTEVFPTPPSPPCPCSDSAGLPARPSWRHPLGSRTCSPSHFQVLRRIPLPIRDGQRGHGALKELTASGPRESSYLQVREIKTRIYLER